MGAPDHLVDLASLPAVRTAVEAAPIAMLVADPSGAVLAANDRWSDLTGLPFDPGGSSSWLSALDQASRDHVVAEIRKVGAGGHTASLELEVATAAGHRWSRWWLSRRLVGEQVVVAAAVVDIHEDLTEKQDLEVRATHDDLTGLLNRRFFIESVEQALRRTDRWAGRIGVLYIDLDGFKEVNDQASHAVGDRVLRTIAARLRDAVRSADVVARIGGDEFAVLLERLSINAEADVVSRRIEAALNGSVEIDGRRWPVSASVGLALSEGDGESTAHLLERADRSMYEVKRSRRPATARTGRSKAAAPSPDIAPSDGAPSALAPSDQAPAARHALARGGTGHLSIDVHALSEAMESMRRSLQQLIHHQRELDAAED